MTPFCYYNGSVVTKDKLSISIDDLGFSRGYSLFEHCRTYFGTVFHLEDHLIRLQRGASSLFLRVPYSLEELAHSLHLLFHKNGFEESGFKIYLTAGIAIDGITPSTDPTFIIYPYPLPRYTGLYPEQGLILKTTPLPRAFPYCKTTFYVPALIARKQNTPCDDILFVDESSHLLESSTAGFLAFIGDTLIAPEGPLLASVTQEILVELARSLFKIERRPITYDELPYLTEAFLCSTTREVYPIVKIDDYKIGTVTEYRNTLRLKEAFVAYVHKQQWPLLKAFQECPATSVL